MTKSKSQAAARQTLDFIYGHAAAFRSSPDQAPRQFAAAGLMRCCLLLRGMLALEEAGLASLAGILARQHWETWLVSLYVLLGGQEALLIVAGDDIFWKRRLSGKLGLGIDYHPDWSGTVAKLNYKILSDRVQELLKAREAVRPGVTGYDITYSVQSLFALHANMATIGSHIEYGDGEWAIAVETPPLASDMALTPVLHTVHLAQYVLREFGLDGDALDPFVADLLVPAAKLEGA